MAVDPTPLAGRAAGHVERPRRPAEHTGREVGRHGRQAYGGPGRSPGFHLLGRLVTPIGLSPIDRKLYGLPPHLPGSSSGVHGGALSRGDRWLCRTRTSWDIGPVPVGSGASVRRDRPAAAIDRGTPVRHPHSGRSVTPGSVDGGRDAAGGDPRSARVDLVAPAHAVGAARGGDDPTRPRPLRVQSRGVHRRQGGDACASCCSSPWSRWARFCCVPPSSSWPGRIGRRAGDIAYRALLAVTGFVAASAVMHQVMPGSNVTVVLAILVAGGLVWLEARVGLGPHLAPHPRPRRRGRPGAVPRVLGCLRAGLAAGGGRRHLGFGRRRHPGGHPGLRRAAAVVAARQRRVRQRRPLPQLRQARRRLPLVQERPVQLDRHHQQRAHPRHRQARRGGPADVTRPSTEHLHDAR